MEPNFLVDLVNIGAGGAGAGDRTRMTRARRVSKELRKEPRVPVRNMVLGLPTGDLQVTGNVSVSGFGFELENAAALTVGDTFGVRLTVPDNHEPLNMRAELCHLRFVEAAGLYYGGGRFIEVDELYEYPLFRYVEEASLALLASAVSMP